MFNFSACVCPGLANSPRKGPSLALLVMLIINNHNVETGVTTPRGACATDATLVLSSSGISGNAQAEGLGCTGGECPVPALCLGRQALTTASSHTPRAVEQGNQVTAERGCSSAVCRRVCGSLTCWVSGRCPSHWEYWRVLSLL